MTDVRLTATNPEDSSVVPVACNSRGELLTAEPVIEAIDNPVAINGDLSVLKPADTWGGIYSFYPVASDDSGAYMGGLWHNEGGNVCLMSGGYRNNNNEWTPFRGEDSSNSCQIMLQQDGTISFRTDKNKQRGSAYQTTTRFTVSDLGPSSFDMRLERPGDTRAWRESISVFDELEFLRAQVRGLMEKLKMTPEGGWEVWDGSDDDQLKVGSTTDID